MARARKQPGRPAARSTSRKTRPAEVEIVEEEGGFGFEEGVIFITSIVLIAAFIMVDMARGAYGEGMFFK